MPGQHRPLQTADAEILDQIRVNVAFEQMIVAVLAGALVGAALTFILKLGAFVFGGAFSLASLVTVALETMLAGFLIFLVGFFASVAIGAPLFMALEKRKRRNAWPYLAASLAVALATFVFISGDLAALARPSLGGLVSTFVPAIVIAIVFARLMQPHWRAAEKAEAEAEGPITFRLH